jgi:hypothetical protein
VHANLITLVTMKISIASTLLPYDSGRHGDIIYHSSLVFMKINKLTRFYSANFSADPIYMMNFYADQGWC